MNKLIQSRAGQAWQTVARCGFRWLLLCLACLAACTGPKDFERRSARSAVRTAQRIDPYAVKRHADILAEIRERGSSIKIVFLGDSITDFWRTTGKNIWPSYQAAPYQAVDFGVAGDRTEHVLWRLANGEIKGIHPQAVVLLIGANNVSPLVADRPEWVAAGVRKIVRNVHAKLPGTKVLVLAVFPRSSSASATRQRVRALNPLITQWNDGGQTRSLDLYRHFLGKDDEIRPHVMYIDQLHLTPKGYQIWDQGMRATLRGLSDAHP